LNRCDLPQAPGRTTSKKVETEASWCNQAITLKTLAQELSSDETRWDEEAGALVVADAYGDGKLDVVVADLCFSYTNRADGGSAFC
jgi:hypothetical protein